MSKWNERQRERRLDGQWGDYRVQQLLEKADVYIAPDYTRYDYYRCGMDVPHQREVRTGLRYIALGIVAAMLLIGAAEFYKARGQAAADGEHAEVVGG
jgi:hypothetical protein